MPDKRSAVEGLALREAIGRSRTLLRCCRSEADVADAWTKLDNRAHDVLRELLRSQVWRIVWDPDFTRTADESETVKDIVMDGLSTGSFTNTPRLRHLDGCLDGRDRSQLSDLSGYE